MNLNIHRVKSVVIDQIETIEHDDGRKAFVRRIIVTNHQGSFEIVLFAKQPSKLNITEQS